MLEDQAYPAHPLFSKFFYGPPDPHRDSSFKRSVGPSCKGLCPFWIQWACFLTNDGVKLLEVQSIQKALSAADTLIVCKHAWNLHLPGKECPAEFGSQSDNSHLMGRCRKVISL